MSKKLLLRLMASALLLMPFAATAQMTTFRFSYDVGLFDIAGGMVQTPTGEFVVAGLNNSIGPYYGNAFQIDANGNVVWAKAYTAGFASNFSDIKNVSTGGYIITGSSTSSGGGAILLRLDASGNILWSYRYQLPNIPSGNASSEYGNAVIETSDGGFLVGGGVDYFWDGVSGTTVDTTSALGFKVNSSGVLQWSKVWTISVANPDEHYINDVAESADGYFFVGQSSEGTGTLSSNGDYPSQALVVKTDFSGNLTYIRRWGASGSSQGINCAIRLSTGNILTGGFDDTHGFMVSFSGTGSTTPTIIFNRRLTGSLISAIYIVQDVMENSDGNYSFIGTRLAFLSVALSTTIGKVNSSTGAWIFGRYYAPIGLSAILPEGGLCSDQGYYVSMTDQQAAGFNANIIRTNTVGQTNDPASGCPGTSFTINPATVTVTFSTPTSSNYNLMTSSAAGFAVTVQTPTRVQHCLNIPSVLSATATHTNNNCFGGCAATATATPSGGTSPYTYSWNTAPVQTGATATGLCQGNYTCTVTDNLGATTTVTVAITQPASGITATSTTTPVNCSVGFGTASVTPSGGTGPYSYSWAPSGGTSSTATVTVAANYTCTITDANGCTTTTVVAVPAGSPPTATLQSQGNNTCFGGTSGTATVSASGGTGPYTYAWTPSGGNAATATGLAAGTYTCTVTDATGCPNTVVVTITQPTAVTGTTTFSPSSCSGNTGSATVTPTGGTPGYTYSWSPSGGTGATATGLAPGPYVITITDANGCTGTANVTVGTSSGPTASLQSSTNVLCNGAATGTAAVSVTGGNPGYTYSWAPSGGSSATATGLSAGMYTCTITDQSGCVTSQTVSITEPGALAATVSTTQTACVSSGAALATPTGGAGSYTYVWSSGGTSQSETNLGVGTYTCTITDFNGCTTQVTANITLSSPITVAVGTNASTVCSGTTTLLTASGATNYNWMPGNLSGTSITVSPAVTTTYTLIGTDGANCADTTTFVVNVNPSPTVSVTAAPPSICQGDSVGIGATGASSYLWLPGNQTTQIIIEAPMTTTTYTVIGTDALGCNDTTTVTVTVNTTPIIAVTASTDTTCSGSNVVLTGSGATTYNWMPGSLTGSPVTVNPTANTTYTVVGLNGVCADTATIDIAVLPGPTMNITSANYTVCQGSSSTLTATGAVSYVWSSGGTSATETVTPTTTTTYTVTGTNAIGCTSTATFAVVVNVPAAINVSGTNTICNGSTSTLTASGGVSYVWSTTATSTSITVNPTTSTTYSVVGTDANGCTNSTTYSVTVVAPPVATASGNTSPCPNTPITLTATGGGTYLWNTGGTAATETVTPPTGTTTYTVVVSNGTCTDTATVTVTVGTGPSANAGPDTTINYGGSADLNATGGTTYSWSPTTDLDNPTSATPVATPTVTTVYTVTVTDANGCTSIDSVTVFVTFDCGEIFVPNIFSPNGDGHNDELQVYGTLCVEDFHWSIYDRWGELVFETDNPADKWDGTYKDKKLDPAVFVYKLSYTLIATGEAKEAHGNVTLAK